MINFAAKVVKNYEKINKNHAKIAYFLYIRKKNCNFAAKLVKKTQNGKEKQLER
jgi:hypothetical protein